MNNQAENLRLLAQRMKSNLQAQINGETKITRVITVTSGKGGVGKSNFTVNLGIALCELGQKVIILDADLGLANIDVILGISPAYNLAHVMAGEQTIKEILCEGPKGVKIIPGGSGMHELANLKDWQLEHFLAKLSQLEGDADILLIDTGAGLSRSVLSFALAADEIIVITTPEPTALTDAYGLIKTIRQQRYQGKVNLVVNRVFSSAEANVAYNKLKIVVNRFLKYSLDFLGYINEDPKVAQAVREQQPFALAFPHTQATHDIYLMAAKICNQEYKPPLYNGVKGFFHRVANFLK